MVGSNEVPMDDSLSMHGSSGQSYVPEVLRSIPPIHTTASMESLVGEMHSPNMEETWNPRGNMIQHTPPSQQQHIMDGLLYEHIKAHPPRENLLRAAVTSPTSNSNSRANSRPSSRPTTPTYGRGRTYSNTSSPNKENASKLRSVSPDMSEITYASEAKPRRGNNHVTATATTNHTNNTHKKSPQRLSTRTILHQDRPITPVRSTTPVQTKEDIVANTTTPKQRKQLILHSAGGRRDLTYGRNGSMLGPFNQMTKEMTYEQYTRFTSKDLESLRRQLVLLKLQLTSKVTCDRVENESLIKRMWLMVTKKEEEAYTISVREKTMEEFVKVHNRLMEIVSLCIVKITS